MAGTQATSFAVFAVMAHFVSPRDFGLISISYLAIQSLQALFLNNIYTFAARRQIAVSAEYTTTFWMTLALSLVLSSVVYLSAPLLEQLFNAVGLAPVLRAMSLVLVSMGLARTHETWLMRHFHFRTLALRGFIGAVIGGTCGVLLAVNGFGVMALVGQQLITSGASLILLWVTCPWKPGLRICNAAALEILKFLRTIIPTSAIGVINQNCDTFLVALFLGPSSVGVYNVGKRLRLVLQLVVGAPISGLALPSLAEMQNDPKRLQAGVLKSLRLISLVCCPVFIGTSAISQDAVSVMFGHNWQAAAPVLEILSLGGLCTTIIGYNDTVLLLLHRQVWTLHLSLFYSGLAASCFLIIHAMNISSPALPFVLPYCLILPLSVWLVLRLLQIPTLDWLRAVAPAVCAAIIMVVGVKQTESMLSVYNDLTRLLSSCLAGGIIYGLAIYFLFRDAAMMLLDIARRILLEGKIF
jgi:O-antigen/teichoic acid export membrane protein